MTGGLTAPISRKQLDAPDGKQTTQFALNIGELAAPDRRYSAEEAFVTFNGSEAVFFTFLQRRSIGGEPRSMISVKMYADAARQFFETFIAVLPDMNAFVTRTGVLVPNVAPPEQEPAQSVAMLASLAQTTFSGFEAEMRFYHVSPYAIHVATQQNANQVQVEPVVQVDLPTSMLIGAIRQLERIVPNLPRGDQ